MSEPRPIEPTNDCTPQRVYGTYEQTLFLGCSVMSFSTTAGWNGQASEVTVELARDPCKPPADKPKKYWTYNLASGSLISELGLNWYDADPGFTRPNCGAPVYFRVADFEYSGLIQGWTIKEGPDGNPVYSVKLVDPRVVLEHTQVILDRYEGPVKTIANLVNVYGHLEYEGILGDPKTIECADHCNDDIAANRCPPIAGWGAPANGFGGAMRTERGLPWLRVRRAIQDLTGQYPGASITDLRWCNRGIRFRAGNWGGFGELNVWYGAAASAQNQDYILDISDLPEPQDYYYRVSGPTVSMMDIINQVCQDAGADYTVELLPVPSDALLGALSHPRLIIKVRTISRKNQSFLGGSGQEIQAYIKSKNILLGGDGILNDTFGTELRTETNTTFLIGAPARQYHVECETDGDGRNPNITPFWGWDAEGKLIESKYKDDAKNNYSVKIDIRKINLTLNTAISEDVIDGSYIWVTEPEIRLALGDFQFWRNFTLSNQLKGDGGADTALKKYLRDTLQLASTDVDNVDVTDERDAILGGVPGLRVGKKGGEVDETKVIDAQTFFNWFSSYASDFYGKQFLVLAPHLCWHTDGDTKMRVYSDLPSTEGGWPSDLNCGDGSLTEASSVMGLMNPSIQLDLFKDETGKVEPILYFLESDVNLEQLNGNDYVTDGTRVWVRGTIAAEWVEGHPDVEKSSYYEERDLIPHNALIKMAAPVFDTSVKINQPNVKVLDCELGKADTINPNVGDLPNHLGGQGASVGSISPPMYEPKQAGVPTLSNTRCYGPYIAVGHQPGCVACEFDDGIAPWNYGGIAYMDLAAAAKVANAATSMQTTDRGEVTVPGYPTESLAGILGQGVSLYATRVHHVKGGLNAYERTSHRHIWLDMPVASAGFTCSISSMNCTVGAGGVTTSYTISTYTPVFGRFAKGNAERIKQVGLHRLKNERERRAGAALKRLLKAAENRSRKPFGQGIGAGASQPKSPAVWFAGKLLEDPKRKVVLAPTKTTMPYYKDFENTSVMTMDGLLRPVSNYGDADLPQLQTSVGPCAGSAHMGYAQGRMPSYPPPPYNMSPTDSTQYPGLKIFNNHLDPFADPISNLALLNDDRGNGSTSGHDIEGLARKTNVDALENTSLAIHSGDNQDYASDYRYLALRGPLMIHGWGYDTFGKPVPNSVGDSAGQMQDTQAGLTDKFKEDWLHDAREWPMGPLDLRWDRRRGVWTTQPPFRMFIADLEEDISAESMGNAKVILEYGADKEMVYDEDGVAVNEPGLDLWNKSKCDYTSGDRVFTYFNAATCQHWAIPLCGGESHKIRNSGCHTMATQECTGLNGCLAISSGLKLWSHTDIPDVLEPNDFAITGPTLEASGCTGNSALIPPDYFEHIRFADGLHVSESINCSYIVKGPKVGGNHFTDLVAGSGIDISLKGSTEEDPVNANSCIYEISASGAFKGALQGHCEWGEGGTLKADCSEPHPCTGVDCVTFGSGLIISSGTAENNKLTLQVSAGPLWSDGQGFLCDMGDEDLSLADGKQIGCMVSGSAGLRVNYKNDECDNKIILSPDYSHWPTDKDWCCAENDPKHEGAIGGGVSQTVVAGRGIAVEHYDAGDEGCKTLFSKQLSVMGLGERVTHITSTQCGGVDLLVGNEVAKCGEGCDSHTTHVAIGTNGLDFCVTVVTGIECSGDTFVAQTTQMEFCSGLLMGYGNVCS